MALSAYFGRASERIAAMHDELSRRAEELGLAFNPPEILANTRKAHVLTEYARDRRRLDELHRELFRVNFVEGGNLGADAVLMEATGRVGLNPEQAMAALDRPEYLERVQGAIRRSRQIGVTGVPTFIVDGKYMIVGAHPYESLRDALRQIAQGKG